ncbi:MAG TPA: hypothetical protein VE442_09610 [Jatrophihabitans sp.]|jgi:hypothetical protein|nr:hypothetical protein [Jatrophihabitans sp.]
MKGGQVGVARAVPAALGSAGLVCVVIGTFLPWLYSGSRSRNSYATDGAARRLLGVTGVGDAALAAWPFVGLACGAAIAALLVGLVRTAAVIGLLAAAGAAAGAIAMLTANENVVVRTAIVGPIVTLAGSLAVPAAVTIHVFGSSRSRRENG